MAQENTNGQGYVVEPKNNQRVKINQHNPEEQAQEKWVDKVSRIPGPDYTYSGEDDNKGKSDGR